MDIRTGGRTLLPPQRIQSFSTTRDWLPLLAALLLAAGPAAAATLEIEAHEGDGLHFDPLFPTIHVGDTVTWSWYTDSHSVTSGDGRTGIADGLFDSGIHLPPFSYSFTFQNVGVFPYMCLVHRSQNTAHIYAQITVVAADPTPTPPPSGSVLCNISTRVPVGANNDVLIGGFIVSGTQPKKVMVRAIGPSLPVSGALPNPTLELYSGQTLLESNDNWIDSPNKQAIIDSTIPPTSDLESAIIRTLPANNGAYTAVVRGVNQGTGVGLVEVYDLDRTVDSKLANISTRGLVQTDTNVMIGGFIVMNGSQKVIARAIGPSLSVQGKLADPLLELHDKNGALIQSNDNWRTGGQEAEIIATTVPPSNDLESAIVGTLPAGNYTAVIRGVNGGVGVALVEVYALN
jgi:plastocyanin